MFDRYILAMISGVRRQALLVSLAALVFFLPGLWWGLPSGGALVRARGLGPDEPRPDGAMSVVYSILGHAAVTVGPQYPWGQYFAMAAVTVPYELGARALGQRSDDPGRLMLLQRLPSLLMAAATIGVMFLLVAPEFGLGAGLAAAAALALAGPMPYYARTANMDAGALLWTVLALPPFIASLRDGLTPRRAALLGLLAALATGTKDEKYAFFAGMALALAPSHFARTRKDLRSLLVPVAVGVITGAVSYALVSGLAFDRAQFKEHVNFITYHGNQTFGLRGTYFSNPATPAGYLHLAGETLMYLAVAMGPLLLLAAVGIAWAARHARRWLMLLVPPATLLLGVSVPVRFVLPRFLLPTEAVLAVFAGLSMMVLSRPSSRALRASVGALAVAGFAYVVVRACDLTWQMLRDSRDRATPWLARNVRATDTLGYYGARLKLPLLPAGVATVPMWTITGTTIAPTADRPQFIAVIPQQIAEPVHEAELPDSVWQKLVDGSAGYRQVLAVQTRALIPRPMNVVPFVNPPVRVFARDDVYPRLDGIQIEIPDAQP